MKNKKKQVPFSELQKEWYEKIKKSGFNDIEQVLSDGPRLKLFDSCQFNRERVRDVFQYKQDYFLMAEKFLNQYQFISNKEAKVWRLHAEGLSVRAIVSRWGAKNSPNKDEINQIVRRLAAIMLKGQNE